MSVQFKTGQYSVSASTMKMFSGKPVDRMRFDLSAESTYCWAVGRVWTRAVEVGQTGTVTDSCPEEGT